MSDKKNNNIPMIHSADELTINFSKPIEEINKEGEKSRELIKSNGAYTPDGRVWVNKKTLPHLLATDSKATRRIYNDLENNDKLENGKKQYASVEAVHKEVSKRIQEPRDRQNIRRYHQEEARRGNQRAEKDRDRQTKGRGSSFEP